jgi:hypothetical protein
MRIAFATYKRNPGITEDDALVAHALRRRGTRVDGVPWDSAVDWESYSAVVARSTWDFHHRLPEFRRWLDHLTVRRIPTFNPTRLLRWNTTKRYLHQLQLLGIDVIPTLWTAEGEGEGKGDGAQKLDDLLQSISRAGWPGPVVVKPIVSASAHGTWVAHDVQRETDQNRLRASLAASTQGLMLQPFLTEIQAEGEWSLVFLGGAYSHAVLKRPMAGDFRVQVEHGGSAVARDPAEHIVRTAEQAMEAMTRCAHLRAEEVLYARVDGVVQKGRFLLMELEAVEPCLFFGLAPQSADRMAACLETAIAATLRHS